jgi:MGT family glycosyltransferase
MKTILVMPDLNWLSHTTRTLQIAIELRNNGFNVIYAGNGEYMKLPLENGFEVREIYSITHERVLAVSRSGRLNWYNSSCADKCIQAELKLFDEIKPDIVFNDFRLTLSTSCEIAHIPLVVTLNAAWTNYYTIKIRCPEHFFLEKLVGRKIGNYIIPYLKEFFAWYDAQPINRIRKKYGLVKKNNIWDIFAGDLNLLIDIPEYGPTNNLPNNFHYIGPMVWEPNIDLPEWYNSIDRNKPCIYFTMGSTGYPKFFQEAIDLFGNTDYQCIITTAGMAHFDSVPSNIYICDYAPGNEIMKIADLVVCHGGNGTIYQALSNGVPIIGIPTMHDQEFNLDRVIELGAGIQLSELKYKPENLKKAIHNVLNNNQYRKNALKYAEILKSYNAPKKGAELIKSFVMG